MKCSSVVTFHSTLDTLGVVKVQQDSLATLRVFLPDLHSKYGSDIHVLWVSMTFAILSILHSTLNACLHNNFQKYIIKSIL